MRPPEFTAEQIIEAGKALQAANRTITGFALRQQVGGGNPTRLKQVWDEFLKDEASTVATAERVADLPIEVAEEMAAVAKALTERLVTFAVDLNDKANKAADGRVAQAEAAAATQHESDQREQADAMRTIQELEAKLGVATAESAGLAARLADRDTALQAQAVELAQVRERLTLTEQAARSAAEEHVATVAEVASLRDAVAQAASAEAGLKATVDQMTHQIQLLTSQLERGHADHEAARQAHASELQRVTEAVRLAHAEAADLRTKLDDKTTELQHVLEQNAAVKLELAKAQAETAALAAQRDGVAVERDTFRSELTGLRDQLATLAAQRDSVTSERDALRGQVNSQLEIIARFSPGVASKS